MEKGNTYKALNLGCFNKHLPGFINVDIRETVGADVIDDAFKLEKFENNSVDLIYCCHMLEHLEERYARQALERWYDVLKHDGVLRLAVPDIEAAAKLLLFTGDISTVKNMLWGSQIHEFDYHYTGWTFDSLKKDLWDAGFSSVKRWDQTQCYPHNYIDDYSHSYWPSPNYKYKNGKIVSAQDNIHLSLNVQATKC